MQCFKKYCSEITRGKLIQRGFPWVGILTLLRKDNIGLREVTSSDYSSVLPRSEIRLYRKLISIHSLSVAMAVVRPSQPFLVSSRNAPPQQGRQLSAHARKFPRPPKTRKPKTWKAKTWKPKTWKPKTRKPKTWKPKTWKPKTRKPKTWKPKTWKPKDLET